jgi:hypothetical protein
MKKPHASSYGAADCAFSREKRNPLRHGRVAWLTALQPITVAGPRPICTAFPASLACKLKYECMSRIRGCQSTGDIGDIFHCAALAIFPVWLAFLDERAQAFLRILEAVELIEKNGHRLLQAFA